MQGSGFCYVFHGFQNLRKVFLNKNDISKFVICYYCKVMTSSNNLFKIQNL